MAGRCARPLVTALGLAGSLGLLLASPAAASTPAASAASGTTTVKLAADAWYSAGAACTSSPTGCLPAAPPASPYPAKTLHVGVAAGQEESRTYVSLDLTALPAGTSLTGGILRLPVGGNEDGSVAPDTATLQACLVTAAVDDTVEGSTASPPKVDCTTTSPAKYVAAAGSAPAAFTVDLAPFAPAWTAGASGLALLPATDTPPNSAWHVAMSAHDRTGSSVPPPSATVSYAAAAAAGGDFGAPSFAEPPATTPDQGTTAVSFAAPPLAPQTTNEAPAVTAPAQQPAVAPQAPPVAPQQPIATQAFLGGGFAYPGVFLLPLLFAGGFGWLGRMLTRDLAAG